MLAREAFDPSISSAMLVEQMNKNGGKAQNFNDFKELETYIRAHTGKDDVIIFMGAGNIYQLAAQFAPRTI